MGVHARLVAVLALLGVAACGSSPGVTSPAPASGANPLVQGGTWSIFLEVDSCLDTRSECPTLAIGAIVDVTLRTAPAASALAGVLTSRTSWITPLPVLLSGQLQADGSVRFSGSYDSGAVDGSFRVIDVQEFIVRHDERSGLTGMLTISERRPTGTRTVKGRVLSASRQPFDVSDRAFQGAFDGFATLRSCTGLCPGRQAGTRMTLSLRLTQSGGAVAGEFGLTLIPAMPLTGSVNGNTVTFAGERHAPVDEGLGGVGTTFSRIESFSATIDALGRLAGTLRLYNEGLFDSQLGAGTRPTPFTEILEIDLTTVIRQ